MAYPSIRLRNIGPIEEGEVRLHPLTVLIGKNNTGKTYAAQAVYSAFKALEQVNGRPDPLLSDEEVEELMDTYLGGSASGESDTDLGGSIRSKAERWTTDLLRQAGHDLEERLKVYFDIKELEELQRWDSESEMDVSVSVEVLGESCALYGLGKSVPPAGVGDLLSVRSGGLRRGMLRRYLPRHHPEYADEGRFPRFARVRLSRELARLIWTEQFLPSVGLGGNAYYLPAGRSGLLEAWTDVVRLRLQHERDRLALTGREPAALGGVALDFLSDLLPLMRYKRSRKPAIRMASEAVDRLEQLIAGEVELGHGRDKVPSLIYSHKGREISLQRASSMVAEVAPLLSWVKHILRPGDLLLIDEPEAHMHPEAILAVAESLVALAGAGVRVLCTTHSSEFLRQVSNCMLRSQGAEHASGGSPISPDDLGVYRFEDTEAAGGTRIVAESIDPEWGISETEHVAVAERLARETEELLRAIGR